MPNHIYPHFTEEEFNAAFGAAAASVEMNAEVIYFQRKLIEALGLPRRYMNTLLGLTDDEVAANSDHQRQEVNIPFPDRRIYYMDFIYGAEKEKPLSGGFAFKLKRLNFGLTNVFL
jgi:hypothetical protein